jgi:hypothetical protein
MADDSAVQTTATPVAEVQALQSQLAVANRTIAVQRQEIVQLQRQVEGTKSIANHRWYPDNPLAFLGTFLLGGLLFGAGPYYWRIRRDLKGPKRQAKRGLELPPPPPGSGSHYWLGVMAIMGALAVRDLIRLMVG